MRQKLNRMFPRLPLSFLRGRVADAGGMIDSSRTCLGKNALLNAITGINPKIGHLRVRDFVKTNYVSNGSLPEGPAHRFPRGAGGKLAPIPPPSLNRSSDDSFSLAFQNTSTFRAENSSTTSRLQFAIKQLDSSKANIDDAYSRIVNTDIARYSSGLLQTRGDPPGDRGIYLESTRPWGLSNPDPPGRWTTGWSDPPGEPPPNIGCGPPGARSGLSPPGRWTTGWNDPPGEPPPDIGCGPPGVRSGLSPPGRWTTGWNDSPRAFVPERSGHAPLCACHKNRRGPPGSIPLNSTSLSAERRRGPLLVTQPGAVRQDAARQHKPKSRKIKPWL